MSEPQQVIQPSPVPMTYNVRTVSGVVDGAPTSWVALEFFTPVGQAVYFLPKDFAKALADHLLEHATGGLTIARGLPPQNGRFTPPGGN
jgi:hypothetical protein